MEGRNRPRAAGTTVSLSVEAERERETEGGVCGVATALGYKSSIEKGRTEMTSCRGL